MCLSRLNKFVSLKTFKDCVVDCWCRRRKKKPIYFLKEEVRKKNTEKKSAEVRSVTVAQECCANSTVPDSCPWM